MYIVHNDSNTRLYTIWKHMKGRCYNPNNTSYSRYGGVGITVYSEWRNNFISFRDWALSAGYASDLTIDRIDSTKGYNPENCRWTTPFVQACNTKLLHSTNKSGYRGVSWNPPLRKWEVSIAVQNKTIKLGYFTDILIAAKAYDSYVIKNNLPHTINNVLADAEYVAPNTDQLLISSNTSGFRGVSAPQRIAHLTNNWAASIQHQGKKIWSGYFNSAEAAAKARDTYIITHNLPHKLNFPTSTLIMGNHATQP